MQDAGDGSTEGTPSTDEVETKVTEVVETKVTEVVETTVTEVVETTVVVEKGLFSRATAAASGLKDSVANKVSDLKDAGVDVALELVEDFNAMLPVLREAGYTLLAVDIALAVPPKLVATFSVGEDLEADQVEALLAANEGKKLTTMALRSLVRARKLQARIGIGGLAPKGIQLEVGLSPQVVVQFG